MSAQNDNVLIVQSGNVLLTGAAWRGGSRNTSHDATGSRPSGGAQESKEGTDHATGSGCGDRSERTACAKAAGKAQEGRRSGGGASIARPVVQPANGIEGKTKGAGGSESLCRGFGPTLASEYLSKDHGIDVSRETVRNWMAEAKLWRVKTQCLEKIHAWRARRSRPGELVQWDTSEHAWLEKRGETLSIFLFRKTLREFAKVRSEFFLYRETKHVRAGGQGMVEPRGATNCGQLAASARIAFEGLQYCLWKDMRVVCPSPIAPDRFGAGTEPESCQTPPVLQLKRIAGHSQKRPPTALVPEMGVIDGPVGTNVSGGYKLLGSSCQLGE